MTNIKSSPAAPARYAAAPIWSLLVLSLAFLISSKETTAFTSQLPSTTLRHPKQHNVALLSSSSDDDDATSKLLEKARKLREEVSAVEQSKAEAQKQNDAKAQAQREAEMEEQKQKDQQRLRYSAEVPILKDMGDEVMERVDFPPRLKGGKSRIVTIQAPM
eukprot:scaffold8671_cov112-Skeletonema_dohrnii-CCMP3373.AAC.14